MNQHLAQLLLCQRQLRRGRHSHSKEYHVLPPVTKGNLSIFPIVGGPEHDTAQFLTLDEGLRSGSVVVDRSRLAAGTGPARARPFRDIRVAKSIAWC